MKAIKKILIGAVLIGSIGAIASCSFEDDPTPTPSITTANGTTEAPTTGSNPTTTVPTTGSNPTTTVAPTTGGSNPTTVVPTTGGSNPTTVVPTTTPTPTTVTQPVQREYTVSFDSAAGSSVQSQIVKEGNKATEPANPSKNGYEFKGWYLDGVLFDFNTLITQNITLTAKWEEKISEFVLNIEYHIGEDVKYSTETDPSLVTLNTPYYNNYTFIKWIDEAGNDVTNDSVRQIELSENKTLVLTAVFDKPLEYVDIVFNTDCDTTIDSIHIVKGEIIEAPSVELTKTGYSFGGWYESLDGAEEFNFANKIEANLTLNAKWIESRGTDFGNNLKKDGPLTQEAFPSIGNPKMLVIPINLDPSNKTDKIYNDIKIAFSGTEQQTGWESVSSYYKESSYGKLNIQVDVAEWFTPSQTASYYDSYYDEITQEYGDNLILHEALAHFDSKYDYNDYDYDKDGFIDSVWLIYNSAVNYDSSVDSIYWAFTSWDYPETTYDGIKPNYYAFAGTDFMYEQSDSYDSTDILVDAHTYIHETGHLLGLDDYYDYDETSGYVGGCYGADMMDYNIGDHGPINKILLGWVNPIVVTETTTIDINSFAKTGDVLLVTNNKNIDSIYEEYFLIEFYDGSGLNAHDEQILTVNGQAIGIRVWHVDATQNIVNGEVELAGTAYQTGFKYNNSDTDYGFLEILRADNDPKGNCTADILYTPTSNQFGSDVYSSYKLHSQKNLFFTMTVNSIENASANVTITFKSLSGSGSADLPWI